MLRQRNGTSFLVGLCVWLAVVLLAFVAIFRFTGQVSAQQGSTSSTLSTPTLGANATANGIELSWTAVTDAVRYELWTWTSADGWQQLGGDSLTGTSYSHTDAAEGTTYHYAVRAVDADGETSAWSEYASAATGSAAAPTLRASATANGIALSWTAVSGAVRYQLWTWTGADGWQQLGGDSLTATTYTHGDVAAGTTYYYTVRSVHADGETSAWAQYVSATALQEQQGSQHTATPTATATATTRPLDTATPTPTATPTATAKPRDEQGRSPATATATAAATATATPTDDQPAQNVAATGAPTISGTAQVCKTLTADVSNIADQNGLENVSYSVTWSAGEGYLRKQTVDSFTYVVQTMDLGMTLNVYLHFDDDDGYSEFAESANTAAVVAAASPSVPNAPGRVRVQTSGSGKLLVSWEGPFSVSCRDGGSPVTGFKVQWKEAADDWGTPGDVSEATGTYDGSPASYTINGLTDGVEYSVRVLATNAVGYGSASTAVTATPQE